jgi:hypothetical protein
VVRARSVQPADVNALIERQITGRSFGVFGELPLTFWICSDRDSGGRLQFVTSRQRESSASEARR